MAYTTLISTAELAEHLHDPDWAIVDCRFALNDPAAGQLKYLEAHIPGAVYANLNHDLSAPVTPGQTGRHPLPDAQVFAATLGRWGIDDSVQVVAYDDAGGMVAGRLWWMLRWMGHDRVALLDGDWRAWQREARPTESGEQSRSPRRFSANVRSDWLANADEILTQLANPDMQLLDARAVERYQGRNETLDAKAGHIPGAKPAPFSENLDEEGYFRTPDALRARFTELLGNTPAEEVVVYCGSGVSAAHNLVAMVHAGLGTPRLYVGSWSEWITDPNRPIATGDEE